MKRPRFSHYLPVPLLIPLFLLANWPLPSVFRFDLAILSIQIIVYLIKPPIIMYFIISSLTIIADGGIIIIGRKKMARAELFPSFPDKTATRVAVGLSLLATPIVLGAAKYFSTKKSSENQQLIQDNSGGKIPMIEEVVFTPNHLDPEGQLVYESV